MFDRSNPFKKYELVEHSCIRCRDNEVLYQIRALKDFGDVRAGELGGYIANESCLSHLGNCWVYDFGKVYSGSIVTENALVRNYSEVLSNSTIQGEVTLRDHVRVLGSKLFGYIEIEGTSEISDSMVMGRAKIKGSSRVGHGTYLELSHYVELNDVCINGDIKNEIHN